MKICSKCGNAKPIKDFEADKRRPDGIGARCKKCANSDHRKYRPLVAGTVKDKRKTSKKSVRENMISKHGKEIVEISESIHYDF